MQLKKKSKTSIFVSKQNTLKIMPLDIKQNYQPRICFNQNWSQESSYFKLKSNESYYQFSRIKYASLMISVQQITSNSKYRTIENERAPERARDH